MKSVPNIISTKDLSYLEDMLNWNYILIKKINNYVNEVNDTGVKRVLIKTKNDLDKLNAIRDNLTRKYNNKFIEKDIVGAIKGIEALEKRKGKYNNRTNILERLESKDEQIQE